MARTPTKKINMTTYFENLIVRILYILNIYVKFRANEILFTIRLFFMHNLRLQKLEI